jgi:hypothetical protein
MYCVDKTGKIMKDHGSHPSANGALSYAKSNDLVEKRESEVEEGYGEQLDELQFGGPNARKHISPIKKVKKYIQRSKMKTLQGDERKVVKADPKLALQLQKKNRENNKEIRKEYKAATGKHPRAFGQHLTKRSARQARQAAKKEEFEQISESDAIKSLMSRPAQKMSDREAKAIYNSASDPKPSWNHIRSLMKVHKYDVFQAMQHWKTTNKVIGPAIDKSKFPVRRGLEGPFQFKDGRVLYYDARKGEYYDSTTDLYLGRGVIPEAYDEIARDKRNINRALSKYASRDKPGTGKNPKKNDVIYVWGKKGRIQLVSKGYAYYQEDDTKDKSRRDAAPLSMIGRRKDGHWSYPEDYDEETVTESAKGKFSTAQLNKLKQEYGKLDRINPETPAYDKLIAKIDAMSDDQLLQIFQAKIKFLRGLAMNRLRRRGVDVPGFPKADIPESEQIDEVGFIKKADYDAMKARGHRPGKKLRALDDYLKSKGYDIPDYGKKKDSNKKEKNEESVNEGKGFASNFETEVTRMYTAETEKAIKEISSLYRRAGYKAKSSRQSAMFQTDYTKGTTRENKITHLIHGWHGKGKYGKGAVVAGFSWNVKAFKGEEEKDFFKDHKFSFEEEEAWMYTDDVAAKWFPKYKKWLQDCIRLIPTKIKEYELRGANESYEQIDEAKAKYPVLKAYQIRATMRAGGPWDSLGLSSEDVSKLENMAKDATFRSSSRKAQLHKILGVVRGKDSMKEANTNPGPVSSTRPDPFDTMAKRKKERMAKLAKSAEKIRAAKRKTDPGPWRPKKNFLDDDVEHIDELKKDTYLSYANKAGNDALKRASQRPEPTDPPRRRELARKKRDAKINKRLAGVNKAIEKAKKVKEDAEQIDELQFSGTSSLLGKVTKGTKRAIQTALSGDHPNPAKKEKIASKLRKTKEWRRQNAATMRAKYATNEAIGASNDYSLVKFDDVAPNPSGVVSGVGTGTIVQTGSKKEIQKLVKQKGGRKAGFFLYFTHKKKKGDTVSGMKAEDFHQDANLAQAERHVELLQDMKKVPGTSKEYAKHAKNTPRGRRGTNKDARKYSKSQLLKQLKAEETEQLDELQFGGKQSKLQKVKKAIQRGEQGIKGTRHNDKYTTPAQRKKVLDLARETRAKKGKQYPYTKKQLTKGFDLKKEDVNLEEGTHSVKK